MSSVLSYEALIAHSYAVLLSSPPDHTSPLVTEATDVDPNDEPSYPPLGAAGGNPIHSSQHPLLKEQKGLL